MSQALISVIDLHKYFKSNHAVRGLSFTIPAGVCIGLLGPNGAGKTTTIEMLEGIKIPSQGEIRYRDELLRGKTLSDYKNRIGIQFQSTALMDFLTVSEVLDLFGGFYPAPIATDELIKLCDLSEFKDAMANKVSGGQKQRLLLAMALINDPEIVFLDEPTTGLDPQSRRNFWSLISSIKQRGKTVVLTTHYMDEAEVLCDKLYIIDHGSIIAEGSPQALLREHFTAQRIELSSPPNCVIPAELGLVSDRGSYVSIETDQPAELISLLVSSGTELAGLQVKTPTLEDLFLKLTGHTLRD